MLWAFAREDGLPFSKYIARVGLTQETLTTSCPFLILPGRPTHPTPPLCYRNNHCHKSSARSHQYRFIRRLRRLHLFNRSKLLFLLHPLRIRNAAQAPHNSSLGVTLGAIQIGACRGPNHRGRYRLLDPWGFLLDVADDGQAHSCKYELLCSCIWGSDDL